jgi:hypothetical protein
MKKNIGNTDKLIRIALAILLIVLFTIKVISGILGYVFLGMAIILALTSFMSFCPLYTLFGINSRPAKKNK